jgi:hypothetical protein
MKEIVSDYSGQFDPVQTGVYACRVESDMEGFHQDCFLMRSEDKWFYCMSDQKYRGQVFGWIGPLPRTKDGK